MRRAQILSQNAGKGPWIELGGKLLRPLDPSLRMRRQAGTVDRSTWIHAPSSDALVPSCFLLLVVMPGATSSVLAPSSDALRS